MTLQEFINNHQSKYAIIRTDSYLQDPVAQSISSSPRQINVNGVSFTLLSLEPARAQYLADYVQGAVEFEFTQGSGLVTLLLHTAAIEWLREFEHESLVEQDKK